MPEKKGEKKSDGADHHDQIDTDKPMIFRQNNLKLPTPLCMGRKTSPITTQNDLQLLLFMRLWKSRGELTLSTVRNFVKKSAGRQIELPEIPNRNLKSELNEMKENLTILLQRLE